MKIKKFYARDMKEAFNQIKAELGNDAVIVSSHKVRQKGLFGIFKPVLLEVTAAVDRRTTEEVVEKKTR